MAKKQRDWEMFNTLSSMECDVRALMVHSVENERLLHALESAAGEEDGFWIVKSTFADAPQRHRKAHYQVVHTYGLRDLLNSADLANGFDIGFSSEPSPTIVLVAHGAAYATGKRIGHVIRIIQCRLLDQATSHLVETSDELSKKELKSLFHAEEKLVSLQPCIQQCKKAMEERGCT